MKIVYDDLSEFAEILLRCNRTLLKNRCEFCPFYDRCQIDDKDNRHIMCGDIERNKQ